MSQILRISHPYPGLAVADFEVVQTVRPFSRGQVTLYSVEPIPDQADLKLQSIFDAIDHTRSFFATLHFRNQLLKHNPFGIVRIRVDNDRSPEFPIALDVVPPLQDTDVDLMIGVAWGEGKQPDLGRRPSPWNDMVPLKELIPLPKGVQDVSAALIRQAMWREAVRHKTLEEFIHMLQKQVPSFRPHEPRPEVRQLMAHGHRPAQHGHQVLNRPHPKEIRPKGANVIQHASVTRVTM